MKRMKKAVITAMLAVCVLATASAQTGGYRAASEAQRKEIVAKITQTAASVRTMKCDFTQVKQLSFMNDKVTSEGRMYYKKANKIRWEYTRPYAYVFSTDGTTVHMTSGKGGASNRVPVKSSKLFSEISRVMVGGVSGAGLVDSPDFSSTFSVGQSDWQITLTPRKKEVRDLFASVRLYVGKSDGRVRRVELEEKSGDRTTITLKNVQANVNVDDALFNR